MRTRKGEGGADLFELLVGSALVGMMHERHLAVPLLDLVLCRLGMDPQRLVVILSHRISSDPLETNARARTHLHLALLELLLSILDLPLQSRLVRRSSRRKLVRSLEVPHGFLELLERELNACARAKSLEVRRLELEHLGAVCERLGGLLELCEELARVRGGGGRDEHGSRRWRGC